MVRADGLTGRLINALAARPTATTVSTPVRVTTRWAAALAARPITTIGEPHPPSPAAASAADQAADGPGVSTGTAREPATVPLRQRVARVTASMVKTTPDNLQVDEDGDICIHAGTAMVFVRVREDPPLIDVFSPVVTDIPASERLYAKLSELTNRMPIGRVYWTGNTVWASVPVFGRDFQPTHLMLALQVMVGLADELDDRLSHEFGGKRFFETDQKPAVPQHLNASPTPGS